MAIELKQSLRLSQQLVMTPQLQQAIKLLQMNRMEIQELITQEMTENPVLEEGEPDAEPAEEAPEQDDLWENYIDDFQAPTSSSKDLELPAFENILTKTTSLEDHLFWQFSMLDLTEPEKKLGELIIGNLSESGDGYLGSPLEELAQLVPIDLKSAEKILSTIQHFDPIGVAARSLQECLLIQARLLGDELVLRILEKHMSLLEKKQYAQLGKILSCSLEEIHHAVHTITELEPKPGLSFQTPDTQYITPDIYIYKVGNDFSIVLNDDGMPRLRVSPYYRSIMGSTSKNTKEYVQDKLRSAIWLIRSIHNRQKTIYKVTEAILARQREFFEKGVHKLKPMVLKDVAQDVGMHESTISRVTTNKYAHTPIGIFELKYFFNSSIHSADGSDSLASESVKEKIKALIIHEDAEHPLSDQKLVKLLRSENIDIARRTIAKYRDMLGILSSSKRKRM